MRRSLKIIKNVDFDLTLEKKMVCVVNKFYFNCWIKLMWNWPKKQLSITLPNKWIGKAYTCVRVMLGN